MKVVLCEIYVDSVPRLCECDTSIVTAQEGCVDDAHNNLLLTKSLDGQEDF